MSATPHGQKERPILFSGAMVRAIRDNRKTQTRRIVKMHRDCHEDPAFEPTKDAMDLYCPECPEEGTIGITCPYGKPGDRLWVRETTCIAPKHFATPDETCVTDYDGDKRYVSYKADGHSEDAMRNYNLKWTPSILVPRWASRSTLEVTGVRVERLQDITEADAIAEGCSDCDLETDTWKSAVEEYGDLWDRINGEGSWNANPWVWVVEFKREKDHERT